MIHILDVSVRSVAYPELYRDTIFTIIVYPDVYHDTVFLGGVFPCLLCGCTRASLCPPVCVGAPDKHVVSRCFLSRVTVESVHCRNESIGRHAVSRVVQRTLGKFAALSVGVDSLSRVIDQVRNLEFSVVCARTSLVV